jgi:hypothetical protein
MRVQEWRPRDPKDEVCTVLTAVYHDAMKFVATCWHHVINAVITENILKNTPCRNIGIFGFCKYEKDGCAYNHDVLKSKTQSNSTTSSERFVPMPFVVNL